MPSASAALQEVLAKDLSLFGVSAGRAHRDAIDELFQWKANISDAVNRDRQWIGLHRLRQFIKLGTPILEANDPYLRSREPLRAISPAAAFLSLVWPGHLHDKVLDLMKRYIDAGYMTLGPTSVVSSWGEDVQVVSKAGSLVEAAILGSSAMVINALLSHGATLDQVPAQTRVFNNGSSRKTIEAGDAVSLVDHFYPSDGIVNVLYAELRAAALESRMRRMGEAIARVNGVDDQVVGNVTPGAALSGAGCQVELGERGAMGPTGIGAGALDGRGSEPAVARRRGL